jgi:hypothetical protein
MFAVTAVETFVVVAADKMFNRTPIAKVATAKNAARASAVSTKGERLLRPARACQKREHTEFMNSARSGIRRYDTFSIVTLENDEVGTMNDE